MSCPCGPGKVPFFQLAPACWLSCANGERRFLKAGVHSFSGAQAAVKQILKQGEREMSNIIDKVVVITGASSGIGESTAKLLAQQGARVVLGARRSNRIDAVVKEISAAAGKPIGFPTDVTNPAQLETL